MLQLSFHTCCVVSFVSFFFFVFFALFAVRNFLVACSVCVLWNGESSVDRRLRLKKEVRTNMRFVWFASQVKLYSNWKLRIRSRKKKWENGIEFYIFLCEIELKQSKVGLNSTKIKDFLWLSKKTFIEIESQSLSFIATKFVCLFLFEKRKKNRVCQVHSSQCKGERNNKTIKTLR